MFIIIKIIIFSFLIISVLKSNFKIQEELKNNINIQEDKNDIEENKLDKDEILKILLIISYLPYILVLFKSIFSIFFGITVGFFGNQTPTYGFEAFETSIVFGILQLFEIGILPICLIYQLFYLIRHLVKKHKSKTVEINENTEQ